MQPDTGPGVGHERIGRNDPCPCGSGKKYKKCCLGKEAASPDAVWKRAGEASRRTDLALVRFARRELGEDVFHRAWSAFDGDVDGPDELDNQLFVPWAVYLWRPVGGAPLARRYLDRTTRLADPGVWDHLCASLGEPFTFFEVRDVDPGRGVKVVDLLAGRERFVHERRGSQVLRRWHVVFGRIVDVEGITMFDGMGTTPLEPGQRDGIVRKAQRKLGRGETYRPDQVLDHDLDLVKIYREAEDEIHGRPPPRMANTDGEMLVLCSTRYRVAKDKLDELRRVARRIDGVAQDDDEDPDEFTWSARGNAKIPSWDNTSLGRLSIEEDELLVSANSRERMKRLRGMLEGACGGLLEVLDSEEQDVNAPGFLERARARRQASGQADDMDDADDPIPREVAEPILRDFYAKHMESWLDISLPALGGKTPRQVVRTAAGRAKVDALLRDFENKDDEAFKREIFDRVRRALGL